MNLVSYVDESGTHDVYGIEPGSDTAGVIGYVATPDQWIALSVQWQEVLKEFDICVFHAQEFADRKYGPNRPDWPYIGWSEEKRNTFIRKLIAIARDGTYFAVGGILDVRAYDSIAPANLKTAVSEPYQFCFQLFLETTDYAVNNYLEPPLEDGDKIDFIFDQKKEIEDMAKKNFITIKNRRPNNRLGEISYVSKVDYPPIQVADLLAFVMRQSASRKLNGDWYVKPGGWEDDINARKNIVINYYDSDGLNKIITDFGLR